MRWTLWLGGPLAAGLMVAALAAAPRAAAAEEKAGKPAKAEKPARAEKPTDMTPEQRQQEFTRLNEELQKLYGAKQYAEGVAVCRTMIEVAPNHPRGHYNLACGLARLDKSDEALAALAKAVDLGYDDPAHIQEDEDLASLRTDKQFAAILDVAKVNKRAGGGRYEKGDEVPGTKTVEGFPEGGLRWRVRMSPDATKDKPNHLIVWMHPAWASGNKQIEAMAPEFLKRGYALLVFTHRTFLSWGGDDPQRMAKSLEDAGTTEGLDVARPILLGMGPGGQMALELWSKAPGAYGGLVLCSAYPVRRAGGVMMGNVPIPVEAAVKKTPILVFLGEKDSAAPLWKKQLTPFVLSGVPLSMRYVPNKTTQWLLEGPPLAELDKWLAAVAEGKLPADPPPAYDKKDFPDFKLPPDLPAPEKPPAKGPAEKTPADKAPAEKAPADKAKG